MKTGAFQSPDQEHLISEQVAQLYALAPIGFVATLMNSVIVTIALWKEVPHKVLVIWLLSLAFITVLRAWLVHKYRHAADAQARPRRWGAWFITGMALSGITWGSASIFLFHPASLGHQVFLAFVLGGMVAGASSTYIALRGVFLSYSVPVLVPLALRFFLAGSDFHIAMGIMVILYGILIFVTAERNHAVNESSLMLRFENRHLIDNLEKMVESRTMELRVANAGLTSQISERIRAETALRRSEEQYRDLFESNPLPMWVYWKKGLSFLAVNDAAVQQYGYSREEFLRMTIKDIHLPEDVPRLLETIRRMRGAYRTPGIWRHRKKDGTLIEADITTHEIVFNGRDARLVLSIDITARRQAEEAVRHQAYHDLLTGLPNKELFMDRLGLALSREQRTKTPVAVLFLDLDRFKYINETLGHTVGDRLIKEAAVRLKGCTRESDTVARIGGDEFTMLLPLIVHAGDAAKIAEKAMTALGKPFIINGHELHITVSIGISIYPNDGEHAETLLKNADIAMFHAKGQGGNNYQFYDPSINTRTLERILLENRLRQTMEHGELVVYYQPQVKVADWKIISIEALVRWQHPELGLLAPSQFIPIAEEIGFIVVLDEWVMRTACMQNRAWQSEGCPPVPVIVNLSARQFQQPNLVETVSRVLQETGTEAGYFGIEITETIAMRDTKLTAHNLGQLSGMGVRLSIDDFGTGYSSLSYLKQLPIHKLKIDKSFISDIPASPDDRAIVSAVVAMAHNLGLEVVAEGVETEEQLAYLRSVGCDSIQGFLFSEPLPADKLKELLSACT